MSLLKSRLGFITLIIFLLILSFGAAELVSSLLAIENTETKRFIRWGIIALFIPIGWLFRFHDGTKAKD